MNTSTDCDQLRDQLRDLIPAYSIGATDAADTRLVEDGLRQCPELALDLAAFQRVSDHLAESVPQIAPPPEILNSLLTTARAGRTAARVENSQAQNGAKSVPLLDVPATTPLQPAVKPATAVKPARRRLSPAWLAAAALAIVLFATNAYWINRVSNTPALREIRLPTADGGLETGAEAYVVWGNDYTDAVLLAENFPPLPENSVYQAWVRRGETVVSIGMFRVDANGSGALNIPVSLLEQPFEGMGITTEPDGGSPGPTSTPIVRWRAT